ncbi:STAS domain-containing protein [Streptomyces sp. H27-D2]|uniref:STAS domain-containing protein n=1 Tax=Streptomyces sp. H27-D2 TaxID=3046304 RepID=UPI002DB5A1F5|nr:STAS domain-containing protein [Streptomyces sp. H27-D2]MEC4017269.1 STAS domain-containing protein [Streptomyces sp. H27-D2]
MAFADAARRTRPADDRRSRHEAPTAREFRTREGRAGGRRDAPRPERAQPDAVEPAPPRRVAVDLLVLTAELRVVRTYAPHGLRITGVVDPGARRHLCAALDSIAEVDDDVLLDLSGLEFLDLGGLRLIAGFARDRADRRHVELAGLLPHLRHVISLIGWDDTPGLRLGVAGAH